MELGEELPTVRWNALANRHFPTQFPTYLLPVLVLSGRIRKSLHAWGLSKAFAGFSEFLRDSITSEQLIVGQAFFLRSFLSR
jgi:hypothetical protein